MLDKLLKGFRAYRKRHYSQLGNGPFLLAVSGGIDSMAMASVFKQAGLLFAVAHCNYQLRGAESDADEALVAKWCADHNVVCHVIRFDTEQQCATHKKGVQEMARVLRYDWFHALIKQHAYVAVCTAHHANDVAETVLMNMLRGTGIQGLHGILPVQDGLVRPMLYATRAEITEYVTNNNVSYRNDASNSKNDYLRNAVRNKLLPIAEELVPQALTGIVETATRLADAEVLYKRMIAQERARLMEQRGKDWYIPIRKLERTAGLQALIYEFLEPFGFSGGQVQQVLGLLHAETGHYVQSATHKVLRNRDFLILAAIEETSTDMVLVDKLPFAADFNGYRYEFSEVEKGDLPTDDGVLMVDIAQISWPVVLRRWKTGDYLYPLGMGMKKKKVSRLLIDKKIPLNEKERIVVLESDKKILWVAGVRADERFKLTTRTQKVLQVRRLPKSQDV